MAHGTIWLSNSFFQSTEGGSCSMRGCQVTQMALFLYFCYFWGINLCLNLLCFYLKKLPSHQWPTRFHCENTSQKLACQSHHKYLLLKTTVAHFLERGRERERIHKVSTGSTLMPDYIRIAWNICHARNWVNSTIWLVNVTDDEWICWPMESGFTCVHISHATMAIERTAGENLRKSDEKCLIKMLQWGWSMLRRVLNVKLMF